MSFQILGIHIEVECADPELRALVQANWGHMATSGARPDVAYSVAKIGAPGGFSITRPGRALPPSADTCELLYQFEDDITIELQKRRADLYFLHAAAAEREGRASLFVAESGGGKSTTVWALLHHGFSYLSDELAPIDLASMQVYAYPHAICLKHSPPQPYSLPPGTIRTTRTLHVPVQRFPRPANAGSCPLMAAFFLSYRPSASAPTICSISPGEASARLYANALNQLAHPNAGLDAAIRIAKTIPSFMLHSADIASTCALVCSTLDAITKGSTEGSCSI